MAQPSLDVPRAIRDYDRRIAALIRQSRVIRWQDVMRIRRAYSELLSELAPFVAGQSQFSRAAAQQILATAARRIDEVSNRVAGIVHGGITAQAEVAQLGLVAYSREFGSFGSGLSGLAITPRQLDAIAGLSADLIGLRTGGLGAEILKRVNTALRLGSLGLVDQRQSIAAISRAIGLPASWSYKAERIYVTETLRAHSILTEQGIQDLARHTPTGKKWHWSHIARQEHAQIDGQVVAANQKFRVPLPATKASGARTVLMRYPRDPAAPPAATIFCFVPSTVVEGRFVGALKARYAGPIREIETLRGHRLRVTPNHPVLTGDGWLPAGALREGQYLLSRAQNIKAPALRAKNYQHAPAEIQDVFESFRSDRTVSVAMLGGHDLHGDAARGNGEIDVVGSYRELAIGDKAASLQSAHHLSLEPADARLTQVLGSCALDLRLQRITHARPGGMRSADLERPGARVGTDGLPLHRRLFGRASKWNAASDQESRYGLTRDPEFLGQLKHAASGEISPDEIVSVRKLDFVGHVFDLQSEGGWLLADGIIASNCGCYLTAVPLAASGDTIAA